MRRERGDEMTSDRRLAFFFGVVGGFIAGARNLDESHRLRLLGVMILYAAYRYRGMGYNAEVIPCALIWGIGFCFGSFFSRPIFSLIAPANPGTASQAPQLD